MHVVFLHGAPATGKYTIGARLAALTGLPLFHNHLAVDAALTLFDFGTAAFNSLRATIWQAAFDEAARADRSFIFTFNPESTVDPALIDRLAASIRSAGGTVHFVQVTCSRETLLGRLGHSGRATFGKLTDPALFEAIEAQGAFDYPELPQPLLVVDTDELDADAAARRIADAVNAREGDPRQSMRARIEPPP